MAKEARSEMPQELVEFLQEPRIIVLTTVDSEGSPFVNVISWVLAKDARTLRLMGDGRAQFLKNLRNDPRVAVTVLGAGTAWTIYGRATILTDKTPGVPLNLCLVQITDLRVYEALFWGARLTRPPEWDVTYSPEQAHKLDVQVFEAMRSFPGGAGEAEPPRTAAR